MAYGLVIKNGRIVDGSGGPSFRGDIAVKDGIIVEVGKVSGPAQRVVDASGLAVSPGFIDNHTHFDAQVTWDPLCTSSCYHGVTSVIVGHCGLALAPCHPEDQDALAQMLSRIAAIPIEALRAGVRWGWETIPEYLDAIDRSLGVNVGVMIGHSAVRQWAMRSEASERDASPQEIEVMRRVIREGIEAGALGFSTNQNPNHIDYQGRPVPSVIASEAEIFALAEVLAEFGTGTIQTSQPRAMANHIAMSQRLARHTGRPVVWLSISRRWDMLFVTEPALASNQPLRGKSIAQIAADRKADVLDTFLDLAIEENLETGFEINLPNGDDEAVATFLASPYTLVGLSDAGAHVVFDAGYGYSTRLLGYWVREKGALTLEEAVRKLTFMTAQIYGLFDRGLVQPGYAADLVVFDPDTVAAREPEVRHDLPGGGQRLIQQADGIACTVVNGQVLVEDGKPTGALPGKVLRNSYYLRSR